MGDGARAPIGAGATRSGGCWQRTGSPLALVAVLALYGIRRRRRER
ncbi:MAG: hypothetical protein R2712_03355 [Vicinamibacterales bacterium]